MSWHHFPTDGAWLRVTPASVAALEDRLWLRCNACGHQRTAEPLDFARHHRLDGATPLMLIAKALRCTSCGERKAHCWPEPYAGKQRT